jgi:methyltransferase (TIGR04290 family)
MDLSPPQIEERVRSLGRWFHNIDLNGVKTAPDHFLGDYPRIKWERFAHAVPADLSGKSVLDVGCNAGFYSIEMKRRGAARVVAIDSDETYLEQGRFAAAVCGFDDIEFRMMDVYDTGQLGEQFDLVLFMGVLYHLRHPLLALDILRDTVVGDMMLFQSMQHGERRLARRRLPLHRDGGLPARRLPADVLRREALRRRPDELVDPQPRLRRGYAPQQRLCHRRSSGGRGVRLQEG